jgi:hypothetical protein
LAYNIYIPSDYKTKNTNKDVYNFFYKNENFLDSLRKSSDQLIQYLKLFPEYYDQNLPYNSVDDIQIKDDNRLPITEVNAPFSYPAKLPYQLDGGGDRDGV